MLSKLRTYCGYRTKEVRQRRDQFAHSLRIHNHSNPRTAPSTRSTTTPSHKAGCQIVKSRTTQMEAVKDGVLYHIHLCTAMAKSRFCAIPWRGALLPAQQTRHRRGLTVRESDARRCRCRCRCRYRSKVNCCTVPQVQLKAPLGIRSGDLESEKLVPCSGNFRFPRRSNRIAGGGSRATVLYLSWSSWFLLE